MNRKSAQKGVVTIFLLLAVMLLIVAAGVAINSIGFNETAITASSADAAKALAYAQAGGRDAMQRLTKDMTANISTYDLNVASTGVCPASLVGCAHVVVENSTISPRIITVTGYSGSVTRKIQVDAIFDNYFQLSNALWNEIKTSATASTAVATNITTTAGRLNGWTNPNGNSTSVYFRYGSTAQGECNDTFGTRAPSSGNATQGSGGAFPRNDTSPVSFYTDISSLTTATTYYYCAIGDVGGAKIYGAVFAFKTL